MNSQIDLANKTFLEPGEIPAELTYSPVPLVALFNLNAVNDATHSSIWSGFTSNRAPDRVPIYFKLWTSDQILPQKKAKNINYEYYVPTGILKTNWVSKHLFEIPAVAVLFFDLEFDDPKWPENEAKCAAAIEHVKRQLNGRTDIRLSVVLIQRSPPIPSDQTIPSERASHLCSMAELPANCLFVLPINEEPSHLMQCYLRMESAFAELAKSYYANCFKIVKSHREMLNKTSHQPLIVRHQFKLGFYSELRSDLVTGLKYYKLAYNSLIEIITNSNNLFEVKTLASFLTYKICKLCFMSNFPLDAIGHFRKYVEHFKNKFESQLEFEHKNWMSIQYSKFGTLFDQAVTVGLVPSLSQHPGYYFYEASCEAIKRRKLADSFKLDQSYKEAYERLLPDSLQPTLYFGHRFWRQKYRQNEMPNSAIETQGMNFLIYRETMVNHAAITISLLTTAIMHFKKNKCTRLKKYMTIILAQEYYDSGDYTSCLTALSQVLTTFKNESWTEITKSILKLGIQAAFYSGSGQEFCSFCKEFCSNRFYQSDDERDILETGISCLNSGLPVETIPPEWNSKPGKGFDISRVTWTFPKEDALLNVKEVLPSAPQFKFYISGSEIRYKSSNADELSLLPTGNSPKNESKVTTSETSTGNTDNVNDSEGIVSTSEPESIPPQSTDVTSDVDEKENCNNVYHSAENNLLSVDALIPKKGVSRTPIQVTFNFTNQTALPLPLELSIGNNDNFMFAGNKQVNILVNIYYLHSLI